MALLKSLLDRLPALRKSQDFSVIIPELRERLDIVEAQADDLTVDLENSLFESAEKRSSVRAQIDANRAEQEELKLAIAGAERRQAEAAKAETMAEVERSASEARKTQAELLDNYIQLHEQLDAVARLLDVIRRKENVLNSHYKFAGAHRRDDLQVRSPWRLLLDLIGGHDNWPSPLGYNITGYFPPLPNGKPPLLARMKEVKL
jgi:paraquat-inducible protein B